MSPERARIVSSAHLIPDSAAELSEVEYGLIVASNAFGLWCVRGAAAAIAEYRGRASGQLCAEEADQGGACRGPQTGQGSALCNKRHGPGAVSALSRDP